MSTSFVVRFEGPVPEEELFDLGLPEIRTVGPNPAGAYSVFLEGLSTRRTSVEVDEGRLAVRVYSGACQEDWQLARALLARAAAKSSGLVDAEYVGVVPAGQLAAHFGPDWVDDKLDADATMLPELCARAGPLRMSGPTREVVVGPRVLKELGAEGPGRPGARLVAVMRRVLWPDPRYYQMKLYQGRPPSGPTYTIVALLVETPCFVPVADRLAVNDALGGVIVVPWSALEHLPLTVAYVDDGNVLIEAVGRAAWPEVCATARQFEIKPDRQV